MKLRVLVILFMVLNSFTGSGQQTGVYNRGYTAEQNLAIVANAAPYNPWGMMGFDNRYSGVVGSKLVFDTLCQVLFRFRDDDQWVTLEADMDVVDNILIFRRPGSELLLSIPAEMVGELVFTFSGKKETYRTTLGVKFEKQEQQVRFCQVLNDAPYRFIRIPYKEFIEADYRALYSAQRTYDEYVSKEKYFLQGSDSLYHHVTLKKKSLEKLFPEAKELLSDAADKPGPGQSDEDFITDLLKKIGK